MNKRYTPPLNPEERQDIVTRYAQRDPAARDTMYDALEEYREGLWGSSDFVDRKREVLAFVRGIDVPDLIQIERAIGMIRKGHALTKHFLVMHRINHIDRPGHVVTRTLHPGEKLVMLSHGWVQPEPGVYLHPFEVWIGNEDTGHEVDIDHGKLTLLVKKGSLVPLD